MQFPTLISLLALSASSLALPAPVTTSSTNIASPISARAVAGKAALMTPAQIQAKIDWEFGTDEPWNRIAEKIKAGKYPFEGASESVKKGATAQKCQACKETRGATNVAKLCAW